MWGMPPSVRRIVAENAAAPADEGMDATSSAITALVATTDAIRRSRRRVRSSAATQLLIGSPSQSNRSGNGRTRGTIPARASFVQLAPRQAARPLQRRRLLEVA